MDVCNVKSVASRIIAVVIYSAGFPLKFDVSGIELQLTPSFQLSNDENMLNQTEAIEDFSINTGVNTTEHSNYHTDVALPLSMENTWTRETEPFLRPLPIPASSNGGSQLAPPLAQNSTLSSRDDCPPMMDIARNETCQFLSMLDDGSFLSHPTIQSDGFNAVATLPSEDFDPFYADWPYWDQNITDALK